MNTIGTVTLAIGYNTTKMHPITTMILQFSHALASYALNYHLGTI